MVSGDVANSTSGLDAVYLFPGLDFVMDKSRYKCSICGKEYSSENHVRRHEASREYSAIVRFTILKDY